MNLIKEKWSKNDTLEFQTYLKSFSNKEKIEWTQRIINTNLPLLAISSLQIKQIAKEILKGNYIEFLNLEINEFYENTCVNGFIINKIKDFDLYKKYLIKYANYADNWASCDLLNFELINKNTDKFIELSKEFIKSQKTFVRRIGVDILFKIIKEEYIDCIFKIIETLSNEKEYYVNMAISWLLCDCFIKCKNQTLKYIETSNLNVFAVNKFISKCRDSFRVSKEDKDMLLRFKK